MRKADLGSILADFESQLEEQSDFYDETWSALPDPTHRRISAENYALTIGVMFEGFVNDLIFSYANRDCSRVMEHLQASLTEHLRTNSKAKATFEHFAEMKERKHLSMDELRKILDPEGRNTSFSDYAAIEKRAKQWLANGHRRRFQSLSAELKVIVDVVIAVRNNLAHRSKSSLDRLNCVLQSDVLEGTGLQRNVNRVRQTGIYLKTTPEAGTTRADLLGERLGDVARHLAGA